MEIEKFFSQAKKKVVATEEEEKPKVSKKDSLILDGKKQDNLSKMLAKFLLGNNPITTPQICQAVFDMNE